MKKLHPCFLLLLLIVLNVSHSQVAINTTGFNANSSAMLDVESTTKGMLIPRMTTAQRTAISSPASGLLVYDNTTFSFWFYNGTAWTELVVGNATGWKLAGNSGIDTAINFVGTTDNRDLKFRVNNIRTGTLASSGNVFFGFGTGVSSTTSILTNGIGAYALNSNTVGSNNNAIGSNALFSNTSGNANNAIGTQALYLNTTADLNTALGHQAMYANVSGYANTAVGAGSLSSNTTGHSNVAIGVDALSHNTATSNLIAIGDSALFSNSNSIPSIGQYTIAIGSKSLYNSTGGSVNTAIGHESLYSNTDGSGNIGVGYFTLHSNLTGNSNIAVGNSALMNNIGGQNNSASGTYSLIANVDGNDNTTNGTASAQHNINGSRNTAIGRYAMNANYSGNDNTVIGYLAGFTGGDGTRNVAVGSKALFYFTGYDNVGVGDSALYSSYYFNAHGNTSLGAKALYYNPGHYNTAIGDSAAIIGTLLSNSTAIGSKALVTSSNAIVLGSINGQNGATSDVNVAIGTTAPLAKLHIKHNSYPVPTVLLEEAENDFTRMRFINTNANSFWEMNALAQTSNSTARIEFWNNSSNTVTTPFILYGNGNATLSGTLTQNSDFRLKKNIQPIHHALDAIKTLNGYTYNWKDNSRDESLQVGVIAQEVQKIFPSLVRQDDKGILSVNYSGLIPVLIEALKEQQKQIDELKQMLTK